MLSHPGPKALEYVFPENYDVYYSIGRAASKGVARALGAGCRAPLLVTSDFSERFPEASKVSLLGALEAVYVPLEMREQVKAKATKVDRLGVLVDSEKAPYVDEVKALEKGRIVCRDIGGSDPERMAPPKYVLLGHLYVAVTVFLCVSPQFIDNFSTVKSLIVFNL